MPIIDVKMTPGATAEQKAQLIKALTQPMIDILGKTPESVRVVIQEIPTDDWGIAGETLTSRRKRGL